MLKSKDYETKEFKPKAKSETITEPVAEVKVEPKADTAKPTTSERIARLEAIVESAFVVRDNNTVKKLRRQVR